MQNQETKRKALHPGSFFSAFSSFPPQFVGVVWNLNTNLLSLVEEFAEHSNVSDYM